MYLVETLKKLITFHTVTGNHDEIARAYDYIEEQLRGIPLYLHRYTFGGHESLLATSSATRSPKLWLSAHIDVVPGGRALFHPQQDAGVLRGRGVFDMKFAIAIYVDILRSLGDEASNYDLGLMITADEEVGGMDGVRALLEKEGYRGNLAIIPDGGGEWCFEEFAKGMIRIRIEAVGASAHASRPWLGDNAITTLLNTINAISAFGSTFITDDEHHWHSTITFSRIEGGEAVNQVPDRASVSADIRVIDEADREAILEGIKTIVAKDPRVSYHIVMDEPACGISPHNKEALLFADIARTLYGITMGWTRSHGASDARHFARYGIPSLLVYPRGGGAHSDDEWVDINDLERYREVLHAFIKKVAIRSEDAR